MMDNSIERQLDELAELQGAKVIVVNTDLYEKLDPEVKLMIESNCEIVVSDKMLHAPELTAKPVPYKLTTNKRRSGKGDRARKRRHFSRMYKGK